MASKKRARRAAVLAGSISAAAAVFLVSLLAEVPPEYEPFFLPALYLVLAVIFSLVALRLTRTL